MTVTSQVIESTYVGAGTVGPFPTGFYFSDPDDVKVYVGGLLKVRAVDYTLTGVGLSAGGSVTFTAAVGVGAAIAIKMDPDFVQKTVFVENGPFPAKANEYGLDRLTQMIQRLYARVTVPGNTPSGGSSAESAVSSVFNFGVKGDGVTDDTATFQDALNKSIALYIPPGVYIVGPLTIPATCKMLYGAGMTASILKFKRLAYGVGQILLNSPNMVGFVVRDFGIDCDDVVFRTAGTYALVLNGSSAVAMDNIRILGRGEGAVFALPLSNSRITGVHVDGTGVPGSSFTTAFYSATAQDVKVSGMHVTGFPQYGGVFGGASTRCEFLACTCNGTQGAFGYSMGGCTDSGITACSVLNTSHEAYQFTNCFNSRIENNTAEWDGAHGTDFAISLAGDVTSACAWNVVKGNTLINSFKQGLVAADNANDNLFADNVLKDCGLRNVDSVMGSYTTILNARNSNNKFAGNKISSSGPTSYGYLETNTGVGATISGTVLLDNDWKGAGAITVKRYLFSDSVNSYADDGYWQDAVLGAVSSTVGAIGACTVHACRFLRRNKSVKLKFDVEQGLNLTGAGKIVVLFPPETQAAAFNGTCVGLEMGITAKAIAGVPNLNGVVLAFADGSYPGQDHARFNCLCEFELA